MQAEHDPGAVQQRQLRDQFAHMIETLLGMGRTEAAETIAACAVDQGIWRDSKQRPRDFHPTLKAVPVHDPDQFWFTSYLQEQYPRIRAEIDGITQPRQHGFSQIEEPLFDRGMWDQVTLFEEGKRFEQACGLFPVTASIMAEIPEATAMASGVVSLSWLYPGTHIVPHCGPTNSRLRVHLGLKIPHGVEIRIGHRTHVWEEGKCFVFDDSFEHEVWHRGEEPRLILLFDVWHPDLSEREIKKVSHVSSLREKVKRFMTERGLQRIHQSANGNIELKSDTPTENAIKRYMREGNIRSIDKVAGNIYFHHFD